MRAHHSRYCCGLAAVCQQDCRCAKSGSHLSFSSHVSGSCQNCLNYCVNSAHCYSFFPLLSETCRNCLSCCDNPVHFSVAWNCSERPDPNSLEQSLYISPRCVRMIGSSETPPWTSLGQFQSSVPRLLTNSLGLLATLFWFYSWLQQVHWLYSLWSWTECWVSEQPAEAEADPWTLVMQHPSGPVPPCPSHF